MYLSLALQEMKLISDAREFLEKMEKSQKYCYALTTSGRRFQQDKILAKFDLADFFKIIVAADDVSNGKPHPEPYTTTVEKLNKLPDECLVIEDSDNGILSAKAAGCQACGIMTTFDCNRLKLAGADIVVSSFSELAKILFD
jgi:HAD superfamily hydrolase (TIGR01509 family)